MECENRRRKIFTQLYPTLSLFPCRSNIIMGHGSVESVKGEWQSGRKILQLQLPSSLQCVRQCVCMCVSVSVCEGLKSVCSMQVATINRANERGRERDRRELATAWKCGCMRMGKSTSSTQPSLPLYLSLPHPPLGPDCFLLLFYFIYSICTAMWLWEEQQQLVKWESDKQRCGER